MQENAATKGRGELENSGGKKSKCRKELSSRQSTQLTRNSYTGRWVGENGWKIGKFRGH